MEPVGLRRREIGLAVLASVILSIAMNWPVARHVTTEVPGPNRDPGFTDALLASWNMSWSAHALRTQPSQIFQANDYHPTPDALAFEDTIFGYAPAGLVGAGPAAAVARYNVMLLFASALAFLGAWLLARELGAGAVAAGVAGAAFAYSPWRLSQMFHLRILSAGGIPLALFLMIRGWRKKSPGMIFGGWAVATWQLSLGFSLGLQVAYLLGGLGTVALAAWLLKKRPPVDRRLLLATVSGVVLFLAFAAWQAVPFLRVVREHPETRRTVRAVQFYSPPPSGLLAAPQESYVWGGVSEERRRSLPWSSEQTLFPGIAVLLLGGAGLTGDVLKRSWRAGLGLAALGTAVLALGFRAPGPGRWLYQALYDYGPGWQGVRTPGRIILITMLVLGLLGAAGAESLVRGLGRAGRRRIANLLGVACVIVVLVEGSGRIENTAPRPEPAGQRGVAAPQLHLPSDAFHDMQYMFWSIFDGFPKIANGHSSATPAFIADLRRITRGFPDIVSVSYLRGLGIRSVLFHPEFAPGTAWADVASKPIDGLGISREIRAGVIVFSL